MKTVNAGLVALALCILERSAAITPVIAQSSGSSDCSASFMAFELFHWEMLIDYICKSNMIRSHFGIFSKIFAKREN